MTEIIYLADYRRQTITEKVISLGFLPCAEDGTPLAELIPLVLPEEPDGKDAA